MQIERIGIDRDRHRRLWNRIKDLPSDLVCLKILARILYYLDAAIRQRHKTRAIVGVAVVRKRQFMVRELCKVEAAQNYLVLAMRSLTGRATPAKNSWVHCGETYEVHYAVLDQTHVRHAPAMKKLREVRRDIKRLSAEFVKQKAETREKARETAQAKKAVSPIVPIDRFAPRLVKKTKPATLPVPQELK